MSVPKWRKFNFFEQSPHAALPEGLRAEDTTCSTSGRGSVLLGDSGGVVHVVDRDFSHRVSFQAHKIRVTHLHQLKRHNQLLTIGDEDGSGPQGPSSATMKLWNFGTLSPTSGPPLIREVKIFNSKFPEAEITAVAVWEEAGSTLVLALGLVTGQVYVLQGDVSRDRISRARLAPPAPDVPITGLGFRPGAPGEPLSLYVVNLAQVVHFPTIQAGAHGRVLDDAGAGPRCAAVTEEGELVVGRPEAVYFYDADGRGPCLAFAGEKDIMAWVRGHLAVVSTAPGVAGGEGQQQLTVYDVKHKLVGYQARVSGVAHALCEWGSLVVIAADGGFCLWEKDMGTKLEILFRKSLFPIAISLTQESEPAALAEVHRKFGDHLYAKQDYDGAMEQYLRTIGQLEASYVIRKFLDAVRIHNLVHYLEELHNQGHATADHTALLLNCYTKTKDVDKLGEFVARKEGESAEEYRARIGVEAAVRMCRAAGYYEHALRVAEEAGEPGWRLRILLQDCRRYEEAIAFLQDLPPPDAEAAIKLHGKSLATARPVETTALLMRLCTLEPSGGHRPANPAEYAHVFVERPTALVVFFEYLLNEGRESPLLYNTLLKLYLARVLPDEDAEPDEALTPGRSAAATALAAGEGELTESQRQSREVRLGKALELLRRGWPLGAPSPSYDADTALVLCRTYGFSEGTLYLYERQRLYSEVLAVHMASGDHAALIEACTRLGDTARGGDPNLWVDVLAYFGGQGRDCAAEVRQVLAHVERAQLLPPLVVLQTLAKNKHLTLAVVKDYVARRLEEETRLIEEDRRAIERYEEETRQMRAEVGELRGQSRTFKNTKCTLCQNALELPVVHFLCSHSFHVRCLGENEAECPNCAPENRTLLEYRAAQLRGAAAGDDSFFQQLQGSSDGFSVCADYFGRGMFQEGGQDGAGHKY